MRRAALLLLAVAACGGDADPDPIDTPPDGPPPAEGDTAEVSFHFTEGDPAGLPVVFSGADGRLLALAEVDADGRAVGPMEDGGMVTFHWSPDPGTGLYTIADVQVGDQIVWDDSVYDDEEIDPTIVDTVEVQMPGPFAGATYYDVYVNTCRGVASDPSGTVTVELTDYCRGDGSELVAITAAWDDTFQLIGYGIATGSIDATITAAAWRDDYDDLPITLTGVDPAITLATGEVWLAQGDRALWATYDADGAMPTGGQADVHVPVPFGLGDRMHLWASLMHQVDGEPSTYQDLSRWEEEVGPVTIDASELLPRVTDMALVKDVDPARPTLWWQLERKPDAADEISLTVSGAHYWELSTSPQRREIQLPELPDELAEYRPIDAGLQSVDVEDDAGRTWDDARLRPVHLQGEYHRESTRAKPFE